MNSPYLGRLTEFNLGNNTGLYRESVGILARSPQVANLTGLLLHYNSLGDATVADLAQSSYLESCASCTSRASSWAASAPAPWPQGDVCRSSPTLTSATTGSATRTPGAGVQSVSGRPDHALARQQRHRRKRGRSPGLDGAIAATSLPVSELQPHRQRRCDGLRGLAASRGADRAGPAALRHQRRGRPGLARSVCLDGLRMLWLGGNRAAHGNADSAAPPLRRGAADLISFPAYPPTLT